MSKTTSKSQEKVKDLCYKRPNYWDNMSSAQRKNVMTFCKEYVKTLSEAKTEREFFEYAVSLLEASGYRDLSKVKSVRPGDKVYRSVHGKGLMAAIAGSEDPKNGLLLVGSHIDSPRLDLKPNPLYEKDDQVLLKTHYYGGIKKYQWTASPLALHGVVILKGGKKISLSIGEKPGDPVFTITDLLIHLSKDQMSKSAQEFIPAENLNVLIGGIPYEDKDQENRFKLGILDLLYREYGIVERDLLTAEIEIVPASPARDVGFDRSFVGAYGQDDRVCAWTSLQALLEVAPREKTQGILFFDKEEIGSMGNTGAMSDLYRFALNELHAKMIGREPGLLEIQARTEKTCLLSSDVTAGLDPNYPEAFEPMNSAYCGRGVGLNKYTGSRGKGGSSDCNAEYFASITQLLDKNGIPWQASELGKVDQGGGGTIAYLFANDGMQVLDCGVPVLSMHSCFEITSKADIYATYEAYKAFLSQF